MKKELLSVFFLIGFVFHSYTQVAPNLSNFSIQSPVFQQWSKISGTPVNLFTGQPQVAIPIYNYNSAANGLSLDISLVYIGGGIKVTDNSSPTGLGWVLNAGGAITRSVRGAPDDDPVSGYLYTSAIPADFRSNADNYYLNNLDAQQDVFQYTFNGRSGRFLIDKVKNIITVPLSKLQVIPTFASGGVYDKKIISFTVIAEDGIKYEFNNAEYSYSGPSATTFQSANNGRGYFSTWYLTAIIAPFNTDRINFNYIADTATVNFKYPQVAYVRNSDGVQTATYAPSGTTVANGFRLSSVNYPGNVNLNFNYKQNELYAIKLKDSILRYGFLLEYKIDSSNIFYRKLLNTVTPYTSKERKESYRFSYITGGPGSPTGQDIQNKQDYWGYFNGANNGVNLIPRASTGGSDRDPNFTYTIRGLLSGMFLPDGGAIFYNYEPNDHSPYIKQLNKISASPASPSTQNISINSVFSTKQHLIFKPDSTVNRQGTAPSGNWTIIIKKGGALYTSFVISLSDLFYCGLKDISLNLENGAYTIEALPVSGFTTYFPVNIFWENKFIDNTRKSVTTGGVRVSSVSKSTEDNISIGGITLEQEVTTQQYFYINTDSTSSGFLGDIPQYQYSYTETNSSGSVLTSYTASTGDPVNNSDYSQMYPAGYSRVEVIEGTKSHNLGKKVYEFTSLKDVNSSYITASFPYTPVNLRDWGLGLPKQTAVYDSIRIH